MARSTVVSLDALWWLNGAVLNASYAKGPKAKTSD
jgi:hypothetical protein